MKTIYILLITVLSWSLQACTAQCGKPDTCTDSIPCIYPDYAGVTFPLNIAPPNFRIGENADAFQTEIGTGETADILYTSKSPEVIIPTKKWKKLLQKAAGKEIFIRITLLRGGKW
ncbi:cytochrome C biosynthesis protein, partial [Bacteroides fragilis]|nr:cytochrome C biosynthesis protein [Bacteroides fragilis]